MKILFKHIFKNIWAHKLRTIMLVVCIAICSFTAMICFDMSGSLDVMIRSVYSSIAGSADMEMVNRTAITEDFDKDLPEHTYVGLYGISTEFDRRLSTDYSYVGRESVTVLSVEGQNAKDMGLIRPELELGDHKVVISKKFSEDFEYKEGDKIILHGENKAPVEFTVSAVEDTQGIFKITHMMMLVSNDDLRELTEDGELVMNDVLIDFKNDADAKPAEDILKKAYPKAEITNLVESEDMEDSIANITKLFFVLFALCMLLVIFVTVSISERVIVEKMSVVGTFRSLGISSRLTTLSLIFENAMYGLTGGILGCVLYALIKKPFFDKVLVFGTGTGVIKPAVPDPSIGVYIAVVIGAVIIECLCPVKEVVKAIRTPIRDIIFDNKETEYRPSRIGTLIGVILLAVSFAALFFKDNFAANIVAFVAFIAGIALLFNYVMRFFAKLLEKLFNKLNWPIARLAAVEAGAKKSTVGSSVLCIAAAALAMVIYIFANSLGALFTHNSYKCDVLCQLTGSKSSMLSYVKDLEGVEDTEFVYYQTDQVKINGNETVSLVYDMPEGNFRLFDVFVGVPETAGEGEVILDKGLMKKYSIKEGDSVDITFRAKGFLPIDKTLKAKGKIDTDYNAAAGVSMIVSDSLYKEIYKDHPTLLLIKGEDPSALKKTIQDHSAKTVGQVFTASEYKIQTALASAVIKMILHVLIIIGVGLTFIGIVTNQLIGLEGRKRECAVLNSVAMPRGKLSKMFLIEGLISSGIALAAAVPVGIYMSRIFMNLMEILENYIPIEVPVLKCVIYAVFLLGIFTLVTLFPIRALKKMDIVSQLKYE